MKENPINYQELTKPFPESRLEWRVLRAGKNAKGLWAIVAPYIQSRAIFDRLDEVVGPDNWQISHSPSDKGVITTISLYNGIDWVKKSDGAGYTDIESFKGGISDGVKRAAVCWGIGRYLYDLPTPMFANITSDGKYSGKADNEYFKWNPPLISSQRNDKAPVKPPTQESVNIPDAPPEDASSPFSELKNKCFMKLAKAKEQKLYDAEEYQKLLDALVATNTYDQVEFFDGKLTAGIERRKDELGLF